MNPKHIYGEKKEQWKQKKKDMMIRIHMRPKAQVGHMDLNK